MSAAVILPNVGTVVLRTDGSVVFTDRNRQQSEIAAEIVKAIIQLVAQESGA